MDVKERVGNQLEKLADLLEKYMALTDTERIIFDIAYINALKNKNKKQYPNYIYLM